jgi:transposase
LVSRNTYYKWINKQSLSERKPLPRRDRLIDDFTPYLKARWEGGCHSGVELFAAIKEQGFTGSYEMVNYLLRQWRPEVKHQKNQRPLYQPSVNGSLWLLLKPPQNPTPEQQIYRDSLLELSPILRRASDLVISFFALVNGRDVSGFEAWQEAVTNSGIAPLCACLSGFHRDKSSIVAALTHEWSNGQVEGQVNRLKLIKRSMYGRAKLDLLRARVLPMASGT